MKIDIVIPALKKNRYSPKGDLASWGNTTLLEWKISQAKKINDIQNIYVATPDNEIIIFCKQLCLFLCLRLLLLLFCFVNSFLKIERLQEL